MKLFTCTTCGQMAYFDNTRCTVCGHALTFLPEEKRIVAVEPVGDADRTVHRVVRSDGVETVVRFCLNYAEHNVCNWAIPADDSAAYCAACRLNRVIPNLADPAARGTWASLEQAKRRLCYSLLQLGLPLQGDGGGSALSFAFKADGINEERIITGHDNGLITINAREADPARREAERAMLGENYRTLLGHFRHESGHYYWDRLVAPDDQVLEEYRALFGDERADYTAALERHYREGPRPGWNGEFISAYATSHPWEDWAETWSHYLHVVDTVETAESFGLSIHPHTVSGHAPPELMAASFTFGDFSEMLRSWVPLTLALNSLNRGMGLPDLYPFALSPRICAKLEFVDKVVSSKRRL